MRADRDKSGSALIKNKIFISCSEFNLINNLHIGKMKPHGIH